MALVTFGLLSDIQYADIDDHPSYHGQMRYYRNSLVLLKQALDTWNKHNSSPNKPSKVSFVLNLGDIIDGKNKGKSGEAVDRVLREFNHFTGGPVYNLLGNHCLYHLTRDALHPKYNLQSPSITGTIDDDVVTDSDDVIKHHYSAFSPNPAVRFLLLDTYDVSLLGWGGEDHPNVKLARQILSQNPNEDKNSGRGLQGDKKRFVGYNGAIGADQLKWMKQQLDEALSLKQKVILCSHIPLIEIYSNSPSYLWNYDEVMDLVDKYPNVVVALAGHEHDGGYVKRNGVHHFIVPAIVECAPGFNSYATVEIFDDYMQINGVGVLESKKLSFKYTG